MALSRLEDEVVIRSVQVYEACERNQQEAARKLGICRSTLQNRLRVAEKRGFWNNPNKPQGEPGTVTEIRELLKKKRCTLEEVAQQVKITKGQALDAIDVLKEEGINIFHLDGTYSIERLPAPRMTGSGPTTDFKSDENNIFQFGVISDNHYASKYERIDVAEALYDRFASRGITRVYNAGNWIEGEKTFNRHELKFHGMDRQLAYLAEIYPRREGITTYYVAGDDHEGWYAQREGVDIGRYAENKMKEAGREDWVYLGYMEADVRLINANTEKHSILRIAHPGGGSAYALSYAVQKLVESYEGGDKPAVIVAGHFHKLELFNYRNVWCIQAGCTKDQDSFLRKKRIEVHVGGLIVTLEQDPDTGAIISCNDLFRYFDLGYYEGRHGRWSHSSSVTLPKRGLGGV